MASLTKGRYRARLAENAKDIGAAQALRARAFGLSADAEAFDLRCQHILIEEVATDRLVGCFRLLPLSAGHEIGQSYSARYYDLSALHSYDAPLAEVGRFCLEPGVRDPDILRLAWAALTRFVDAHGIGMLIGCSSFRGTDATAYADAFDMLRERHLAPPRWLPRIKAPNVVRFAARLRRAPDMKQAMRLMPPLLKTYLLMGGWVSDHAVIDRELNTLHVFTGVEVGRIPASRQRLLRQAAV